MSPVTSPGNAGIAMTWRWTDEGCAFCPLIATVHDGGCGAVGATKSVEEMMAGDGIDTGCGEGQKRNRAATRITRRNNAADDEPGETGSPGHLHSCFIWLIIVVVTLNIVFSTLKIRIVFPD
jgi:hypothetical protein